MRRRFLIALLAAAFVACQTEDGQEPPTGGLLDDSGRPVNIDGEAARIVSLAPASTEILFSLGVGDLVVGRTRWCDAPPEALRVASVGDGLEPNVEVILERRPDLVIFYSAVANEPAIEQIESLGVSTISVRTDGSADLIRATRLLGRVVGRAQRADSLIRFLESELSLLEQSRPTERALRALILSWDNPPIIIGNTSFLSEIVELAGATNVFENVDRPSLRVSIEAIVEKDPDVVLVAADSSLTNRVDRPEWRVVPAIRDGRFLMVAGNEYSRPSFRMPAAVRRLRAALEDWR